MSNAAVPSTVFAFACVAIAPPLATAQDPPSLVDRAECGEPPTRSPVVTGEGGGRLEQRDRPLVELFAAGRLEEQGLRLLAEPFPQPEGVTAVGKAHGPEVPTDLPESGSIERRAQSGEIVKASVRCPSLSRGSVNAPDVFVPSHDLSASGEVTSVQEWERVVLRVRSDTVVAYRRRGLAAVRPEGDYPGDPQRRWSSPEPGGYFMVICDGTPPSLMTVWSADDDGVTDRYSGRAGVFRERAFRTTHGPIPIQWHATGHSAVVADLSKLRRELRQGEERGDSLWTDLPGESTVLVFTFSLEGLHDHERKCGLQS